VDQLTQLPDRTEEISLLLMGIVGDMVDADLPAIRAERAAVAKASESHLSATVAQNQGGDPSAYDAIWQPVGVGEKMASNESENSKPVVDQERRVDTARYRKHCVR
jgi:hypothetical protein